MITATRQIGFDTGHRVVGQGGKCETQHGHRYLMEIFAEAPSLNHIGMIIDFSKIKELAGNWIDLHWDHNTIIWDKDPNLKLVKQLVGKKDPCIVGFNPTAENMAEHFLNTVCPTLFISTGINIVKIILWETPNCYVTVELDKIVTYK